MSQFTTHDMLLAAAEIKPAAERNGVLRRVLETSVADQNGRLFLWSPAALIAGIWIYFSLASEPSMALTLLCAGAAAVALAVWRHTPLVFLAALTVAGFALGKVRSEAAATPVLRATTSEVLVSGNLVRVQRASKNRFTFIVEPDAIEGFTAENLPRRLRLSSIARFGQPLAGSRIAFQARLAPLPAPVVPGGFDYGRQLWFESIGGVGRVTAPISVLGHTASLAAWIESTLADVRSDMGNRIHAVMEEPFASFAEALITGERSTIPKEMNQSLMASGLFHILSISGLHMWLVAGGVFWSVRAALALVPVLALRFPIKKWAAVAALGMGLFYMLLADSGVATQRSYLMIAIAFFAVLVDRPALSVRTLAIAALVVLLFEPEAAVEASFQMSFLAVLGLVAFYEGWSNFRSERDVDVRSVHWAWRAGRWFFTAAAMSLATTLVAGTMSSIPAAFHFGRLSPYSLIANGLAIPVTGILVMPFALMASLLMPFGLEALPLRVMDFGLRLVLAISDWVAGFPGASVVAPQPPLASAVLLAGGALWLCLIRGWARVAGLAAALAGLAFALAPRDMPDILVERSGQNVAIRSSEGLLVPALPRRARFTVEKWLQREGDQATSGEAGKRGGWTCSQARCAATIKNRTVLYFHAESPAPPDCAGAEIVIAAFPLRGACRQAALRIDRFDLWRSGAHAVKIAEAGYTISTARGEQGARPWTIRPQARNTPFKPRVRANDSLN